MDMEFNIKSGDLAKQATGCIVIAIFAGKKLSTAAQQLDKASRGQLSKILRQGDLVGNLGQALLLHKVAYLASERVLLIGCGKESELSAKSFKTIIKTAVKTLNTTAAKDALCCLVECNVPGRDFFWKLRQAVIVSADLQYSFSGYKSKPADLHKKLKRISFAVNNKQEVAIAKAAIAEGMAISKGASFTKDLANTPPNVCIPSYLAEQALQLAKQYKTIATRVLTEKDMEKLGMGAFLAIARGSQNPAKLITIEYRGAKAADKPVVLVGKGITFDTGGNSLKPATAMIGMKYDMCGAASVFGAIKFAAELQLPMNIVGIIAAAENMPGAAACRPNDIVTSMSGTTIEILNTDAEGRLVLCDALTYAERFNPAVVIDIATLTGACLVALGRNYSVLFSNEPQLADELITASQHAHDLCWQLPIDEDYQEFITSTVADLKNIGNGEAGSITAACFLANFTKQYRWAHLDIAATAWDRSHLDSATGRPVPLLAQYLLNYCKHAAYLPPTL